MSFIETKEVSIDKLLEIRNNLTVALASLEDEILKALTLWQSKALNGFKYEAIMQYHRENKGKSIKEAKEAIEHFIISNSGV